MSKWYELDGDISWTAFVSEFPEYKDERKNVLPYLKLLKDVAPNLVRHKPAVKTFLKSSYQFTGDINFNQLKDIKKLDGIIKKNRPELKWYQTKGYRLEENHFEERMQGKWNNFIAEYPEYKEKPKAKDYFKLFNDVIPSLAYHAIVVKSFMKSSFELTGDVNFANLLSLAEDVDW